MTNEKKLPKCNNVLSNCFGIDENHYNQIGAKRDMTTRENLKMCKNVLNNGTGMAENHYNQIGARGPWLLEKLPV